MSVPGDVIAGAAATGHAVNARVLGTVGSAVCLYWASMALNESVDATVDAVERPQRPVPLRPGPAPDRARRGRRTDRRGLLGARSL
ncbi:hypothetical protein AB0D34_18025 [Streptomyces sp. NPDC048420]|uniref:hypothetical protein n=1 Tax=Streptomyces sp. NPDC048420 TaxID=3155755 RepID=UPI00342B3ACE